MCEGATVLVEMFLETFWTLLNLSGEATRWNPHFPLFFCLIHLFFFFLKLLLFGLNSTKLKQSVVEKTCLLFARNRWTFSK